MRKPDLRYMKDNLYHINTIITDSHTIAMCIDPKLGDLCDAASASVHDVIKLIAARSESKLSELELLHLELYRCSKRTPNSASKDDLRTKFRHTFVYSGIEEPLQRFAYVYASVDIELSRELLKAAIAVYKILFFWLVKDEYDWYNRNNLRILIEDLETQLSKSTYR